jgi:para-nitrobenzyl esterase
MTWVAWRFESAGTKSSSTTIFQQGGNVMFGGKVASIQRLQESARPRPWLRSSLGPALLLGVAFALAAPVDPTLAASTLVAAPDGTFQGKLDTTSTVRQFLGIRYAQPLTSNLRWKPPQPVTPSVATQAATQATIVRRVSRPSATRR